MLQGRRIASRYHLASTLILRPRALRIGEQTGGISSDDVFSHMLGKPESILSAACLSAEDTLSKDGMQKDFFPHRTCLIIFARGELCK